MGDAFPADGAAPVDADSSPDTEMPAYSNEVSEIAPPMSKRDEIAFWMMLVVIVLVLVFLMLDAAG